MPTEMISGPDLGGGFLFQLTLDRKGGRTWFTYHAQEGGQDANGPPLGSPKPLDFLETPEPCQFGGPRCWHRPFVVPPTETLRVRVAYNRIRFVMTTMMEQVYQAAQIPLESTLADILERAGPELDRVAVPWGLSGAAARWALGANDRPAIIEMRTNETGVDRLATLWSDFLVEPTGWTELPGVQTVYGAEAFLGSVKAGTRVRWFAFPPKEEGGGELLTPERDQPERTSWNGREVPFYRPARV